MNKSYISGGITGRELAVAMAEFASVAEKVRARGREAVNPFDVRVTDAYCVSPDIHKDFAVEGDAEHDWAGAAQSVRALMFLDKLAADIDRRHETLEP